MNSNLPPRGEPRCCERLESWMLVLDYDSIQLVRKTYREAGFERAFALATQLKVRQQKVA